MFVKNLTAATLALGGILMAAGAANAQTTLNPGGNVSPVPTISGATGTVVAFLLPQSFAADNAGQRVKGTISSVVYDRGAGLRDFWYQITLDGTGIDGNNVNVTGANLASFLNGGTPFSISVAQAIDADGAGTNFTTGLVQSASASRTADGEGVQFNFGGATGTFSSAAGSNISYSLLVRTDATSQATGQVTVFGSGVGANGTILAPSSPTVVQAPEPGSIALLATGVLPLTGMMLRRRKKA